tara:strand:+ start:1188 stop:1571 length:384 start_codon:yes stop_codon:yes gene_type:complete
VTDETKRLEETSKWGFFSSFGAFDLHILSRGRSQHTTTLRAQHTTTLRAQHTTTATLRAQHTTTATRRAQHTTATRRADLVGDDLSIQGAGQRRPAAHHRRVRQQLPARIRLDVHQISRHLQLAARE